MAAQLLNRLGQLGLGLAVGGAVVNSALYNVDGGHRAVIFDRLLIVKLELAKYYKDSEMTAFISKSSRNSK